MNGRCSPDRPVSWFQDAKAGVIGANPRAVGARDATRLPTAATRDVSAISAAPFSPTSPTLSPYDQQHPQQRHQSLHASAELEDFPLQLSRVQVEGLNGDDGGHPNPSASHGRSTEGRPVGWRSGCPAWCGSDFGDGDRNDVVRELWWPALDHDRPHRPSNRADGTCRLGCTRTARARARSSGFHDKAHGRIGHSIAEFRRTAAVTGVVGDIELI
jgi:hypothetical protein